MGIRIRWTYNPDPNKIGQIEELDDGIARTAVSQGRAVRVTDDENNNPDAVEPGTPPSLRSLLIYYSVPNGANGRFDNDYAAGLFARYDDAILGDGLQDPESVFHADTLEIVSKIPESTKLWGYIDLSVEFNNFTIAEIAERVDQWADMGVQGIFWDLFGYDYGSDRDRQNAAVREARRRDLRSMINIWDTDEAFGNTVDEVFNPLGTPTILDHRDVMYLETFVFNTDAFGDPGFSFIGLMTERAVKARGWRKIFGCPIYSSSIVQHTGRTPEELDVYRDLNEMAARVFGFDGTNCAVGQYAAGGDDLALIVPHRFTAPHLPFRPDAEFVLSNFNTTVERPDLGLTFNFPDAGPRDWTLDP